ncbi:11336_t:CDS:2 [Paraglomus occultum]|uniref:11336_t:CDS:1 n=1 Tax=Paraglomus occultum TaxID=144539 RepID=A0A9N9GGQ5_9GLOM|nr:11336_t:CDS:2 [Paraglomus occultum]
MIAFKALIAILFTLLFIQSVTPLATRASQTVADAVNVIRSQQGLPLVNDNPTLDTFCYNYLYDLAKGTKTDLVQGNELISELAAVGYYASWAGMAGSKGYTPEELVYSLYQNPDTYPALVSNALTDVGAVDYIASDGTEYIVSVFAMAAGPSNTKRAVNLADAFGVDSKFAAKSGEDPSITNWNVGSL